MGGGDEAYREWRMAKCEGILAADKRKYTQIIQ
jgi:hypothetical protein